MTLRLARASARHPVWAVLGWLVFVAGCVVLSSVVGTVSATSVDLGVGDSGRADELIQESGLSDPATEYVLVGPRDGTAGVESTVAELAETLAGHDEVDQVGEPIPSADGWMALPLTLRGDPETAYERVGTVRQAAEQVAEDHPDVVVEQTGGSSVTAGMNDLLDEDFVTAETLSIPVTLVILLIVFGAFVAAVIPVVLALTCVLGAIGLSAAVSHLVPDSGMTANMILLIGMAVGVDYSLFYLKREREERAAGADSSSAIETAAATSGHAVVFSGVAVIVSLAGLYFIGDVSFMSIASAAIVVVAVAVVGSLTVLPALLVLLSRFLDRPRVPLVWRLTNRSGDRPARFWPAMLKPSLSHPVVTMLLTVAALVGLSVPLLDMSLATQRPENLSTKIPAVVALHDMNEHFPQVGSTLTVVVHTNMNRSNAVAERLADLAERSGLEPTAEVQTSSDRRTSLLTLMSSHEADSDEAVAELALLRDTLVPEVMGGLPDSETVVGGTTASDTDYDDNQREKLPWVVAFVLVFTFLMMSVTFRSVVIGAVTLAMNLLSAGAAFGVLVLVFQNTWAEQIIGFTSTGTIISWVPLFLFVVLVGLSMDYHVFVLHRIQEEAKAGASHRDAVRNGIVRSAGVVTSAAIVMIAVFSVFATLSFAEFKQLAIGLSVAVIIDVLVIRGLLLPATLLVTRRATWWPGALYRQAKKAGTVEAPAALIDEPVLARQGAYTYSDGRR